MLIFNFDCNFSYYFYRKNVKRRNCVVGLDFPSVSNISTSICTAAEAGYNRYYIPVAHPRYKREFVDEEIMKNHGDNFTRSIVAVYPQDYIGAIVGKLSDYVNVDSKDVEFRTFSETTLDQEIKWCAYLGIQSVMLTLPVFGSFVNLARLVYSKIKSSQNTPLFLIRISMASPSNSADTTATDEQITENDPWNRWNRFRTFCACDKKLKLALELTEDLPSEQEINRWLGEPIGCVIIKPKTFLTNQSGYPVLSKAHQRIVNELMSRQIEFLISGACREDMRPLYAQYLQHLMQKSENNDLFSEYVHGYEDFLQIPLQPLMDNLDRYTYEIFEKDPVKYREYQRAIKLALLDKKNALGENQKQRFVVMVVGAGRGPIVNAALNAAQEAEVEIKLYAIEKNPHAIVSLQSQKLERWKDEVTIVATDMRLWNAPEKADIMVSELLGSFSDNELSPECLDGAQNFLKDDGISIPSSYSSYICPTQTHKIYAEITDSFDRDKPYYHRYEQPYVVHLQTVYHLAPVQKLFTFHHPNKSKIIDNTRYERLTFKVEEDCVVHGFSGFFDTVLYKDVKLSIVPETFSVGMFSWFPIFFPFQEPIQVKKKEKVEIAVWRLKNDKIVWYEWLLSAPESTHVHNPNGRSYFIGLM